jgi:hypothetical protein
MFIVVLDVGVEEAASAAVDVSKALVERSRDEAIITVQRADRDFGVYNPEFGTAADYE